MFRVTVVLLALALVPPAVDASDGIPLKTLQRIKSATVFLKVRKGATEATGTGFVVQAAGDVVYLVTNHHVVDPKPAAPPPDREGPFPFPFIGPPRISPFRFRVPQPADDGSLTVSAVFSSGTRHEQICPATVVLSDEGRDLALLEVQGCQSAPPAIVTDHDPELVETTSIYVFGFPFGAALSENDRNPAISVAKGTISSLREDHSGELSTVQIDGALNPGNSGGPVVDGQGRLVGVAVATIRGAGIGMAIPQQIVRRMLAGSAGNLEFKSRSVAGGQTEFEASAPLIDPFRKIKSVALLYLAQSQTSSIQELKPGLPLPEAARVDMQIKDGRATCRFTISPPGSAWAVAVQTVTVTEQGTSNYSIPLLFGMGSQAARSPQAVQSDKTPAATDPDRMPAIVSPSAITTTRKRLSASGAERVLESLASESEDDVERILRSLKSFEPGERAPEIARHLVKLLKSDVASVRLGAAEALAAWGQSESAAPLAQCLSDSDKKVRHAVLAALVRLKATTQAEAISARLEVEADREAASRALVALGPDVEASVVRQLAGDIPGSRHEACRILGLIGTMSSLDRLRPLSQDTDPILAARAAEAVRKIESRSKSK